jgi:ParB-like chromosome segregation protein Spo0J
MTLVPLADIELPLMTRRLQLGPFGLDDSRMVKVLREIARREEIWPVEIVETESGEYRLKHGTHRFHASVAAGFSHIPAIVVLP